MKTFVAILILSAATLPLVAPVSARAAAPTTAPAPASAEAKKEKPVLQVHVQVPPSARPIFEDRISEYLGDRIGEALGRQGLKGKVLTLDEGDEPIAGVPTLNVYLIEWRRNITDNVQCTFSATLTTSKGTKSLGLFSGTDMMRLVPNDPFSRAERFENAARDAMRDLYQRVAETKLL